MKRISKGLPGDRVYWQVPGEALGGWWVMGEVLSVRETQQGRGGKFWGCRWTRPCWRPKEIDALWGPGESQGGYTPSRPPERG